jgi:beta-glucanase (GH16 family)
MTGRRVRRQARAAHVCLNGSSSGDSGIRGSDGAAGGGRTETSGKVVRRKFRKWLPLVVTLLTVAAVFDAGPVTGTPLTPDGVAGAWRLAWRDEFAGSRLDSRKWQPNRYGIDGGDPPFDPRGEDAWFSPSNVSVDDGHLVLTVRSDSRRLGLREYPFSSGVVQSTAAFPVRPPSYIEARIAVPECDGCWPAFWEVPWDRWPPEIDNFEFFDTGRDRRPHFNYHRPTREQAGPSAYGDPRVDYRAVFHTYGVLWEDTRVVPYLDGRAYPDVAATRAITQLPLMIILNISVVAKHRPAEGAQMRVDWVRVWMPEHR